MRAGVVVGIIACALLLAGCASATVVSRSDEGLVLRWDEREVSAGRVASQAADLCSGFGFNARRAFAVADDVEGTVHTTRYACQAAVTGPLPSSL